MITTADRAEEKLECVNVKIFTIHIGRMKNAFPLRFPQVAVLIEPHTYYNTPLLLQ